MKLASMANYQQDGIIAVEYDTETETGGAYTIIDGVKEELPGGTTQHNAAGHLATEANYGGDLVSAQYDAVSGTGAASAVVDGVDIEIVGDTEAGNGIMSISISPSITTTPALDSLFPIYWEDIPAEDIEDGQYATKRITVLFTGELGSEYHVTATPTADWQVQNDFDQWAGKGETAEVYGSPFDLSDTMSFDVTVGTNTDAPAEYKEIHVTVVFTSEG